MGAPTRPARTAWTRLLELDKPVPERAEQELEAEAERNFTWNFSVNFLDGAFFWLGLSFISYVTILPLFVSKISPNPIWIALLAVIGQSSWYLPQLMTAGWTEQLARKKPVVVNLGFLSERLPLYLLPFAALFSVDKPMLALVLFFTGYAAHGLGAGIIAPAWTDMIARCFPVRRRGRFFGITSFVGTGLGAIGAIFSGWLLAAYPFPRNFALAFGLAALLITISWFFLALVKEPVMAVPREVTEQKGRSGRKIRNILLQDSNFRNYLAVRLLFSFGGMAAGFVTVAAIQRWYVADSQVGYFTAALLVGQTLGNLTAGFVADRYGHRLSLMVGALSGVSAYMLAWLAPSPLWYNVVFLLIGMGSGMAIVSGILINLEFSKSENRPTYVGIANTTMGIGSVLAPLVGGFIATVSYNLLFGVSALCSFAALLALWLVVAEPRRTTGFVAISAD